MLLITSATTGNDEANNMSTRKSNKPLVPQHRQLQIGCFRDKCRKDVATTLMPGIHDATNGEEPTIAWRLAPGVWCLVSGIG
ncbi:hypothetical protein [Pseudarthrobacter siccitolerans]|uniref:hypothetical protein n=1 Tax=Pseudarthrobacter siccitolerans TaxID=861266 RepID=UPI00128B5ECD|nr:hypothetical protein [Pseudarthrobacter siccitolerans]